jgi:hypothetical protein
LGQESADVALSFLNLNFRVISAWLCPPGPQPSAPKFMTRSVDVALAGDLDMVEQGSSAGACKVSHKSIKKWRDVVWMYGWMRRE